MSGTTPEGGADAAVRIVLRDVVDPGFIEGVPGGPAFYTHLRGAERIVEFRLRAAGRAHERYEQAQIDGVPEPELAGLGLLVLQRAALAVEDLGGLMYAAKAADPWKALTSYYAYELDELFEAILRRDQEIGEFLLLPSDDELQASPKLNDESRAAARKLRDITLDEARELFDFVASFWMAHREVAKTTMHGFGVVAAEHLIAPPGGGELSSHVPLDAPRPFAVVLLSSEDGEKREAETVHHQLDLTPANVEMVRNTAIAAGELYLLVARTHRGALRLRQPWMVPSAYRNRLSEQEQAALEQASR
jgi:hypothetical protein